MACEAQLYSREAFYKWRVFNCLLDLLALAVNFASKAAYKLEQASK